MPPKQATSLRYRGIQALMAARMAQRVLQVWRDLMNPAKVDASWLAVRGALVPIVEQGRQQSADLARAAYGDARREASAEEGMAEDGFRPQGPLPLLLSRLESALDVTGPVEFKKAIAAGKPPQQAMEAAAVRMVGTTQYLALEGGRQVMQRSIEVDERATGWARVTDGDPCAWCAMLASRGPVYKSDRTGGRDQNARFVGDGEFKYHDHCACQAWPSFTNDEPFIGVAEKLYDDWLRTTRGRGGKHAVNAFRSWWESEGRAAYAAPEHP